MNQSNLDKLLIQNNEGINNAVKTVSNFQKGKINPIQTSYWFLNMICLGGLLPDLIISILGRPGHGKCLRYGTKIIMHDGSIKEVQDIVVGDKLMGIDSTPRTVQSLARGKEEMYWIRQNKGIDYCVNKSHILSLRKSRQEGNGNKGDILNISVEEYLKKSDKFKSNYKGYKVDVEFPEKELSIDPYYLGLWLGDGNTNNIRYISNSDKEIINYIKLLGGYQSNYDNLRLILPRGVYIDEFKNLYNLKNIGSLDEKYIPKDYLINSKENRLKLLAGLLDTDGYYSKKDNCFEIVQKNKKLSEQIVFLCNSLGFRVSIKEKKGTIKSTGFISIYYRICIYGNLNIIPNLVKRKKAILTNSKRDWRNTGIKVEFDKVDDYYGFELDGDRLFLLEDFTVTHNTFIAHNLRNDILADKSRNVGVLLYNWEMSWFALLLVQLKRKLHMSFKEILNLKPSAEEISKMREVADEFRDDRLTTVGTPLTPEEFDYLTRKYIEDNLDKEQIFIIVDHVGITVGSNKLDAIFRLFESMASIKLDYPGKLTFIPLGQLNREIERLWRTKDMNPINLRVTSEYIYGADAIQQFSDVIMASMIPQNADMEKYCTVNSKRYPHLIEHAVDEDTDGTKEYIRLKGTNRVYYDFLKVRLMDGDPTLYCEVLNQEQEELVKALAEKEKDYTEDTINF